MRLVRTACFLLLLTALGACGSEGSGDGLGPATHGTWRGQTLHGAPGVDSPTVLATDGEDSVVVMLSDKGRLQSHLSADGEDFEAGPPLETGWRYAGLAGAVRHDDVWLTLGSGGLTGAGNDEELTFTVRAFRSDDGRSWTDVPVEGFSGPADINALVETNGVLLAAGSYRDAEDPSMGGFRPMLWSSRDGASWSEVQLPGVVEDGDSFVADVAAAEGRVYAVGRTDDHAMLWTSDDAGTTWRESTDPEVRSSHYLAHVATQSGVVILSVDAEGPSTILRSTDGGSSWAAAGTPPPAGEVEGYVPLWAGGGRFFTVTEPSAAAGSDPAVCYADIAQCREPSSQWVLYASDDGDTWTPVDVSGIDVGDEVAAITGTPSRRVLTLHSGADGVAVHTWPAGVQLPEGHAPEEPETVELVTVPQGADPEPGVRYHAPLYLHCGMDWLYLGDRPWRRTDGGPDTETGAGDDVPGSWPVAGQTIFGYATLTDAGVVEYSTGDGTVIATYERTETQPPGCD